jgi:hypothetical protein
MEHKVKNLQNEKLPLTKSRKNRYIFLKLE